MRALIQRVTKASVSIDDKVVGRIGAGLVIFLGICHSDCEKAVSYLVEKCYNLRVFKDSQDKMNLSVVDVEGSVLIISQFTLYGDTKKGRRPSYIDAARPEQAQLLYEKFIESMKISGLAVETGQFGADMSVALCNDGPVTLMVESPQIKVGLND